jgi:isoleucyl-tRNA synthetase
VPASGMPELERWVLHRLSELDQTVRRAIAEYDFHGMFTALHNFCAVDLSAFYFDIRKDRLYCDAADDPARRAARTVMDQTFDCLVRWLAPILCFTAEEAWLTRHGETGGDSVHLRLFPAIPEDWRDDELAARWERLRGVRRVITGALELARADRRIGASLQAHPNLYLGDGYRAAIDGLDLAGLAITSALTVADGPPPSDAFTLADVPEIGVVVGLAEGGKCERCWRVLPEVTGPAEEPGLCRRCDAVVAPLAAAPAL